MPHPTGANKYSPGISRGSLAYRHVELLHTRFPDVQAIAEELLGRSETFRTLVENYGVCADALDRCREDPANRTLLEQYTTLRFALERVLLQYIKDHRQDDDVI